jgi:hypothetical protein
MEECHRTVHDNGVHLGHATKYFFMGLKIFWLFFCLLEQKVKFT